MIKAIGAVLVIAGGVWWSAGGVMRLKGRARSLSQLTASLEVLRSEICDRQAEMPEVIDTLINAATGTARMFYINLKDGLSELGVKTFGEIWRKAVQSTSDMHLSPDEEQVFSRLGHSLGKYDTEFQKNAIDNVIREMTAFSEKAKAECERDWKVQAFVGMAASILAVIVLL